MLTGRNGSDNRQFVTPLPDRVKGDKETIIIEIQKNAMKLFSKEIAKMHYAKKRIGVHTKDNLRKLNEWFEKELKKCGRL